MIQNIVALKELRLRRQAYELDVQKFGAEEAGAAAREALQQKQLNLAQFNSIGGFQQMLQGMKNPQAMAPFAGDVAGATGQPLGMAQTMIAQTPAAVSTTMGAATQNANQTGAIDASVLEKAKSEFGQDKVMTSLFGSADNYLQSIPPEQRQDFARSMIDRLNSGESTRSAVLSQQTAHMSPEEKAQAAKVAEGLGLSANDNASLGIAWAGHNLAQRGQDLTAAMAGLDYDLKVKAFQHKVGVDPELSKQVLNALDQRRQAIDALDKIQSTGTKTSVGLEAYISQINNYNEFLRRSAPDVYGKGTPNELVDIPKGSTLSAGQNSYQRFFNQAAKQAGQK